MAKEKRHYFSIGLSADTGYFRGGDEFRGADEPLYIGETADCDVRFKPSDARFAPEIYAAIVPTDDADGRSWRLVAMSPHVGVSILGRGTVRRFCRLHSGDRIAIDGQKAELRFRERCDGNFSHSGRAIVHRHDNRLMVMLFSLLALIMVGGGFLFAERFKTLGESDLDGYRTSVYKLTVDSVDCVRMIGQQPDSVIWSDRFADGHNELGTAFLTTDSLLITARHCVEFWLGNDPDMQQSIADLPVDDFVRRVAEAETWNYTHSDGDTLYVVRSYCSAKNDADSVGFKFNSLDANVIINRDRDQIMTYDDGEERYFWRSITPHYAKRDMELGDIAAVKVDRAGAIKLASREDVEALRPGAETAILGYPETGMTDRQLDFSRCNYQHEMTTHGSGVLVIKGAATHGHSGAPVFIKSGREMKGAAVLSKVNPLDQEVKYAVPTSVLFEKEERP